MVRDRTKAIARTAGDSRTVEITAMQHYAVGLASVLVLLVRWEPGRCPIRKKPFGGAEALAARAMRQRDGPGGGGPRVPDRNAAGKQLSVLLGPFGSVGADATIRRVGAHLEPELWVDDTAAAVSYYERAFGAVVEHRVGAPDDTDGVVQLSVDGARFWLSGTSEQLRRLSPAVNGGATGRVLLVVDDPHSLAQAALAAGGELKSEVAEEHGWLLGRVVDPFGHEWEIGRPLGVWPPDA